MYKVTVNQSSIFEVEQKDEVLLIDGDVASYELTRINEHQYLIVKDHQVYNLEIVEQHLADKKLKFKINGKILDIDAKDKLDMLLDHLGMGSQKASKVSEIKAPMPGLILDIKAKVGVEVKKGDQLLILEAMKMENVIKSPIDGTISKILVEKGQSVEKNQIMIFF